MTMMTTRLGLLLTVSLVPALTADVRLSQQSGGTSAASSGRVAGIVVADSTSSQPIRRAIVTLTLSGAPLGQSTISDDAGRFEFTALPAGRFTLTASRASFLTGSYGATRPGRPGTALALAEGQQLSNIRITLARGAAITGTVSDATGRPVAGIRVQVERRRGAGPATPGVLPVTTDDRGVYRVFGVAPGTYVVSATPTTGGVGDIVRPSDAELDAAIGELRQQRGNTGAPGRTSGAPPISSAPRVVAFTPVFHPSAFSEDDAVGVTVGFGDERRDVNITVTPVPTSTISGSVVGAPPLAPAGITLLRTSGENTGRPLTSLPDGTFRIMSVVPGRYVVRALISSAAGRGIPSGPCLSGETDVQVAGTDLSGIVVPLRPCPQLTGRVSFVGSAPPPVDLTTIRMQLRWRASAEAATSTLVPVGGTTRFIQADGTFQVGTRGEFRPGLLTFVIDIPGSQPGQGWLLRSVLAEGRDVLDTPLLITDNSQAVTPVVVTFTDQRSALLGRLETAAQQPAIDYTILAFTTNQAWWTQPFRRVRTTRPATDGDFVFDDLPPGEYFLAALTDIEPEEWQDPGFLAEVAAAGTVRVTLGEGERKTQNLRLSR